MLRVETKTGSIYELDLQHKLIRRKIKVSSRIAQAFDKNWLPYKHVSNLIIGKRIKVEHEDKLIITSPIVKFIRELEEPLG